MALTLASASSGVVRDAHYVLNPVTGLYERSLLLEVARTNQYSNSEQFDNAVWTKIACTVSANAIAGPDTLTTADKLAEDATTASHRLARTYTPAIGDTLTLSVFAKAAERSWLRLCMDAYGGAFSGAQAAWFNLATGAIGTQTGTPQATITALPNGWYRCTITHPTAATSATLGNNYIQVATSDQADSYAGSAGSGIYVIGGQLEVGAFATSYIPTAGASATRAADNLSLPFTLAPQELSVYAKFIERGTFRNKSDGGQSPRVWQIGNSADTGARLSLFASQSGAANTYTVFYSRDGVLQSSSSLIHGHSVGDLVELLVQLTADGTVTLRKSINGGAETSSTATGGGPLPAAWSDTKLWLGGNGGAGAAALALLRWKLVPGIVPMADMRVAA